eukprot:GHVS01014320.1.p1 GENE.GHVS01014320.1~~GHVS01014320.1.p1  ORF type:complete len:452 (-),score=56.01 GHVS01014320.1:90-1445(-)
MNRVLSTRLLSRTFLSPRNHYPPLLRPRSVSDIAHSFSSRPAFFDYQSTTPVDPRVLDKMLPLMTEMFGNPHSRSHGYGWEAEDVVEEGRKQVARLIHAPSTKTIIFTSGATEANNMAIKGAAGFYGKEKEIDGKRRYNHIITTQIEHKCVLASCLALQEQGWEVTYLPVNEDGLVNIETLEQSIRPDTLMVSIMFINNEIGVIQPMKEIGTLCRKKNILFHTDAAQAVGKVPVNVDEINADLVSISAHKLYGPKGIGALFVRGRPKRVRLAPVIDGGGQERGFRSGTLPAPLVAGFGEACRIAEEEMEDDRKHVEFLYKRMNGGIRGVLDEVILNGCETNRYPGNLNLSFSGVEGESLLMSLKDIAVSSGSACTSESLEPSYVLRAIGVGEELAHTSLRFGIGRFTTLKEVDKCVDEVRKHVGKLRDMSPLWEIRERERKGEEAEQMVWT